MGPWTSLAMPSTAEYQDSGKGSSEKLHMPFEELIVQGVCSEEINFSDYCQRENHPGLTDMQRNVPCDPTRIYNISIQALKTFSKDWERGVLCWREI